MEKEFIVTIYETLSRKVIVKATDEAEAFDKVMEQYREEEIVLTADDFEEMEMSVVEKK